MVQAELDQEWVELILQARQLGLKQQEIKDFLQAKKKDKQGKDEKTCAL
ncbi:anti-repressor SinI family protein [Peribacillus psychrosaccharolyticus]|nr:anti-repressor SinI family protein [Peribacillus psychrosaccharolyticus]MEC2055501.1 anti-repressor SinI family protein [Peribacillus psychrosaccharolyticus]MED3743471.1 anti-repressor SinI family protein [Peribacillus psychrosaccharolyticus]